MYFNVEQATINGGSLEQTASYTTTSGLNTLTYICRAAVLTGGLADTVWRIQRIITVTATGDLVDASTGTIAIQWAKNPTDGKATTGYDFPATSLAVVAAFF